MIIIDHHIEDEVLTDYFFIEGTIDINSEYFIEKIKKGFQEDSNMGFKTNIRDLMTSYFYFNEDKEFGKLLNQFIVYVDDRLKLDSYALQDSWGYCVRTGNKTNFHTHKPSIWSGVLYLNDHSQTLDFPKLKRKIKPEKGRFALFSSFLDHGCKKHKAKETKWGISFNFSPVRMIKDGQKN
jgi:hypothetical protein|tara:strand:- start:2074 stop:2616 length:543 start_codon:yes stop_codon:yes gene_type:complete